MLAAHHGFHRGLLADKHFKPNQDPFASICECVDEIQKQREAFRLIVSLTKNQHLTGATEGQKVCDNSIGASVCWERGDCEEHDDQKNLPGQ